MTIHKTFMAAVLAAFAGTAVCNAATALYSATGGDEKRQMWGTQKGETYDIAIRLDDPSLVGKSVAGVRIPFVTNDALTDISVWLSHELTVENKVNVPDILSVEAVSADNEVTVMFETPCVIPEEGLYVGYTFTATGEGTVGKYPVTVAKGTEGCGLYVHSKRTYMKWKDMAEQEGCAACMTVVLDGDIPADAAAVAGIPPTIAQKERAIQLPAIIRNEGGNTIRSIDYTIEADGTASAHHIDYEYGVLPYYLGESCLYLEMDPAGETGRMDFTLTIDKVNGEENPSAGKSMQGFIDIAEYCPVNRPLVEEYTGLGCGWCPRGIAAFEHMSAMYPGLFVGVAFHEGDDMTAYGQRPNSPAGQPAAYINRTLACDPYCGEDSSGFGIESLWNDMRAATVPVGIDVTLGWADTDKTILNATTETVYVAPCERNVAIAYLLLADGISDPSWFQSNYYSGASAASWIPEMDQFFNGPSIIFDFQFNDIVAMQSAPKGVEGSLPAEITPYEAYSHQWQFDLSEAYSTKGYLLAQDPDRLKVVAIVVDSDTGEAINCNVASTAALSAAETLDDVCIECTEWHDLAGRKVASPAKGNIYIRTDHMHDGSARTSKVMR